MFDVQHILVLALGVGCVVAGALLPAAAPVLIPTGTTIIGGVLGAVQAKPKAE